MGFLATAECFVHNWRGTVDLERPDDLCFEYPST